MLKLKHVRIKRNMQIGTVQVDYNLPEHFDLEYVSEDGSRQRPVMIHRAPFGSLERLIGILIEEYAGDFPIWLAPVQIRLVPVAPDFLEYARTVTDRLLMAGIRAELDTSNDRLGKMIRNVEKAKVPVVGIVGANEMEAQTMSVRTRAGGELGAMPVDAVVDRLLAAINNYGGF